MKSVSDLTKKVANIASRVRQEMEAVVYGEYKLTPEQEALYRAYEELVAKNYAGQEIVGK